MVKGGDLDCQPHGALPMEIHRGTVSAREPALGCGNRPCFLWRTRVKQFQSEKLIFIPSLLSLARTEKLKASRPQVPFGSMESIFSCVAVAFQRGRSQRMVGVGVRGVVMVMAVIWPMAVVRRVVVVMGNRDAVGLAGPGALQFAERAAFRESLHMVVVAFLRSSNVLLEAQHLGAVLAE